VVAFLDPAAVRDACDAAEGLDEARERARDLPRVVVGPFQG